MYSATFKVINNIRNEILAAAAQGANYPSWSDEFARKEVKEAVFNLPSVFRQKRDTIIKEAHLQDMSEMELIEAGFLPWSEKVPGLFLIPLYLIWYMDPFMIVRSISGREVALVDADTDVRHGVIAYGFIHKKREARG